MTLRTSFALVFALGTSAQAQDIEKVDDAVAKELGKQLAELAGKSADLPFNLNPDSDSALGLKAGERGGLIVAEKDLTTDKIAKHEKGVLPLGVLFTRKVTVYTAGGAVEGAKLRTVEATVGDKTVEVAVFVLGIAKVEDRHVLVVYAKGKTPVVVAALSDLDHVGEKPLILEPRQGKDGRGDIVIGVLGKWQVMIPVAITE